MAIKINWFNENPGAQSGDYGYWRSIEGRFTIAPYGYRHNVTPDGYRVTDTKGKHEFNMADYDTVRACKAWALNRVIGELEDDGFAV